jgi:hypothetical protein
VWGLLLDAIRRPPRADLKAGTGAEMQIVQESRYASPVHMIKLTEKREIKRYLWVHPD